MLQKSKCVNVLKQIYPTCSSVQTKMTFKLSATKELHCMRYAYTRNSVFKLDPDVSLSTYFTDSYCLRCSVIFHLSNGIIIKGAKSDAVVAVGVVLDTFILCYFDLEWFFRGRDKWAGHMRNRGSAAGISETFIPSPNSPQHDSGDHAFYCSIETRDIFSRRSSSRNVKLTINTIYCGGEK